MNRITLLLLLGILICLPVTVPAQTGISLQVIAVKGTVKYQSKVLAKNDVITVNNLNAVQASLSYASVSDWVNFINKKDKKILNYYAQKKTAADGKYMFSRGDEEVEIPEAWLKAGFKKMYGEKEILAYFSRPNIFLFSDDTLLCSDLHVYETSGGSGFMLQFTLQGATCTKMLNHNDTLVISRKELFPETGDKKHPTENNSYMAGPMRLVYYNNSSQNKTFLEIPEFNIYFFEDVVYGLRSIGMKNEDVTLEIMSIFSTPEQLSACSGLTDEKEIHDWLLAKVKKIR
jgi:hypothetical protein